MVKTKFPLPPFDCGLLLLGMPFWLFPAPILGLFVNDPQLVELGLWPLRLTGAGMHWTPPRWCSARRCSAPAPAAR